MEEEGHISTEYCSNCKKDIPSVNYVMHASHCSRNIILCQLCEEPVPRSEKEEHFEENHAKVKCECGESIEKMHLGSHTETDCTSRKMVCEYCELELPYSEMKEHKDFCGSRTQLCDNCNKYIQHKDLEAHLNSDCQVELPGRQNNADVSTTQRVYHNRIPPDELIHNQVDYGGVCDLEVDALQRLLLANQGVLSERVYDNDVMNEHRALFDTRNVFPQPTADIVARGLNSNSNTSNKNRLSNDLNDFYGEEMLQRTQQEGDELIAALLACDEDSTGFDYPSVNSETSFFPRHNLFDNLDNTEIGIPDSALDQTYLPCEFCGAAIVAQDLIVHQTGCQFALTRGPANTPSSGGYPNLRSQPRSLPPIQYESLNHENEQGIEADDRDETLLPCEFCDELIPPSLLFEHQDKCDPQRTRPSSVLQADSFYENGPEPPMSNNSRPRASSRPHRPSRPVVSKRTEHVTERLQTQERISPSASVLFTRKDDDSFVPRYRGEFRRHSPPRPKDNRAMNYSPPAVIKKNSAKRSYKKEGHRQSELATGENKDNYEVSFPSKGSSRHRENLKGSTGFERLTTMNQVSRVRESQTTSKAGSFRASGGKPDGEHDLEVTKSVQRFDYEKHHSSQRESTATRLDKNKTSSLKTSSTKKTVSNPAGKREFAPSFDVKPRGDSRRHSSQPKSVKNGSSDRRVAAASNENRDTNNELRTRKSKKKFA